MVQSIKYMLLESHKFEIVGFNLLKLYHYFYGDKKC